MGHPIGASHSVDEISASMNAWPCLHVKSPNCHVASHGSRWNKAARARPRAAAGDQLQKDSAWEEGSSIRVHNQTYIAMERSRFWMVLQEMVGQSQWSKTATVLAALESIYRAEFSKSAEEARAALAAAEAAPEAEGSWQGLQRTTVVQAVKRAVRQAAQQLVRSFSYSSHGRQARANPNPAEPSVDSDSRTSSSGSSGVSDDASSAAGGSEGHLADAGSAEAGANAGGRLDDEVARSSSTDSSSSSSFHDAPSPVEPAPSSSVVGSSAWSSERGPVERIMQEPRRLESAGDADRRFVSLLAPLLQLSHFQQLSRRDAEVAKSLNADYLSQLFILGSARSLDLDLVQAFHDTSRHSAGPGRHSGALDDRWLAPAYTWDPSLQQQQQQQQQQDLDWEGAPGHREGPGLSSPGVGAFRSPVLSSEDVPPESKGMLVFKRGYGMEVQRGRLLLPKLDFLQMLLVRVVAGLIGAGIQQAWQVLRGEAQGGSEGQGAAAGEGEVVGSAGGVGSGEQPQGGGRGLESEGAEQLDVASSSGEQQFMEQAGERAAAMLASISSAGTSVLSALSLWGLTPRMDVLPLGELEAAYPIIEPRRLAPRLIRKVALTDVIGTDLLRRGPGHFFRVLLQEVTLVEPAFQEVVVVYRQKNRNPAGTPRAGGLVPATPAGPEAEAPATVASLLGASSSSSSGAEKQRPIQIRVYRDIPLPNWTLVQPDKLLQFRPLDLVRTDIFALTGLFALIATARYDSIVLDVVTLVSAAAFVIRVVLGYQRMADRYRSVVNDILQQRTVASGEGAIEFLASSAALQQFKQTALAYLLLLNVQQQQQQQECGDAAAVMSIAELGGEAERALQDRAQLQLRFDADEAASELLRLHLAKLTASSPDSQYLHEESRHLPPASGEARLFLEASPLNESIKDLQNHWDTLLWKRVDSVLREFT